MRAHAAIQILFFFLALSTRSTLAVDAQQRIEELTQSIAQITLGFQNLESLARAAAYFDIPHAAGGRLTLESGVPLSTSDQTARSTLYYSPFRFGSIALYTGTLWKIVPFTEVSLSLSGLIASRNYDVFLYDNSGTPTLELTAWSTDTARATALILQDGVEVRSGAPTRRYLGTIRTTGTNTTEDSRSRRFVWNHSNRINRPLYQLETTNSWTYAVDSWRSVNGSAANRVEVVFGNSQTLVSLKALLIARSSSGLSNFFSTGIGVDSTTVNSAQLRGSGTSNDTVVQVWGHYSGYPGLGYHSLNWLERSNATSITVYGDNGDATKYQSGILGEFSG